MMRALNTAGTGMLAQQTNLDVIANNLANVNTTGFKSQRAEFQDLMYQTFRASGAGTGGSGQLPQSTQIGLGTRFASTASMFTQGSMTLTGISTNMAVIGEGFFPVQLPGGNLAYTRDGSFSTDSNGLLVTSDGYQVDPGVTIPQGASAITISGTGLITAILPGNNDATEIGQIQLARFSNPAGLTRSGQNLFLAGGASGEAIVGNPGDEGMGQIQQGYVEGSNVQVVEEMVKMIVTQRAYEINSKAIQTSDEMLSILNSLKR